MNIPVLMIPGFEADDVIGSMALRSAGEGFDVYMVTPDKDYGQLVRPHVYQLRPGKGGGDDELLDAAAVCAKYGIQSTSQVIDMLTICGDASDNVPGVKGPSTEASRRFMRIWVNCPRASRRCSRRRAVTSHSARPW